MNDMENAKAKVLAVYPEAHFNAPARAIFDGSGSTIPLGQTIDDANAEECAWLDAAEKVGVRMEQRYDAALADALESNVPLELAIGFIRYEALRKLNALEYANLCRRNRAGERFDDLVDGLIRGGKA
jgi:hypothetical protein